jgi:hypothetical protein
MRTKRVADAPAIGAGGKGETDDEQQRNQGTQGPGIALGHTRARQVARKRAQPFGQTALVFAPQRIGKVVRRAGRPIGLGRDRAVAELVGQFDAPVDLGRCRPAEGPQRIERGERGQSETGRGGDAHPVVEEPEKTEPRRGEKKPNHQQQRQDKRPATFGKHRKPGRKPRPADLQGAVSVDAARGICRHCVVLFRSRPPIESTSRLTRYRK